jgi:hypothetical protein
MAFHEVFGGAPELSSRLVGHDRNGRPIYQADEVGVRPATPREALQQLQGKELRDDGRSTVGWAREALAPIAGGALSSKAAGGTLLKGAVKEAPTAFSVMWQLHDLLTRYLGNEDLAAHGIVASHDLMPNIDNAYDEIPENRSMGMFIDAGDGRTHYSPPSYADHEAR